MSAQQTAGASPTAGHYSGTNRIPNIKQFMENLDKDKKERDAKIDTGEVRAHQDGKQKQGKNRRMVRDPVTGQDVEIDDVDEAYVKATKDPHVG